MSFSIGLAKWVGPREWEGEPHPDWVGDKWGGGREIIGLLHKLDSDEHPELTKLRSRDPEDWAYIGWLRPKNPLDFIERIKTIPEFAEYPDLVEMWSTMLRILADDTAKEWWFCISYT